MPKDEGNVNELVVFFQEQCEGFAAGSRRRWEVNDSEANEDPAYPGDDSSGEGGGGKIGAGFDKVVFYWRR